MNDQCKHCSYRGDMNSCQLSECSIHDSWYAQQQQQTIDDLCEALSFFVELVDDDTIQTRPWERERLLHCLTFANKTLSKVKSGS